MEETGFPPNSKIGHEDYAILAPLIQGQFSPNNAMRYRLPGVSRFVYSVDVMGLRPVTVYENTLRSLSPVFSMAASPIFTAEGGGQFAAQDAESSTSLARRAG